MEKEIARIEELGYIVRVSRFGVEVLEPYTSDITGDKHYEQRAYATYTGEERRKKFLEGLSFCALDMGITEKD